MSKLYQYIFSCAPLASQSDYGKRRTQAIVAYCEAQALAWAIKAQGGYADDFRLESVASYVEGEEPTYLDRPALPARPAKPE